MSYKTFITHNELNIEELSADVIADRNGAVVVFNGITRDHTDGRKVLFLEYEAYLPMAKAKLNDVAEEMCDKWDVSVVIAHRIGRVDIGESSLIVTVGSPHRASAYQASQYSVDRIKQIVPIWKKEHFDGGEVWIGDAEGFRPLPE
ncbi:MAG: molybdenum cofactor biosynthesis protein MoaE [SAR202 cluster bacterium]|nr:molybdenum cofactor biosynthesis protein MoaE [SAR202 cluster bacterium]